MRYNVEVTIVDLRQLLLPPFSDKKNHMFVAIEMEKFF